MSNAVVICYILAGVKFSEIPEDGTNVPKHMKGKKM
jgi:hypothetical protein